MWDSNINLAELFNAIFAAVSIFMIPVGVGRFSILVAKRFAHFTFGRKKNLDNINEDVPSDYSPTNVSFPAFFARDFSIGALVIFLLLNITALFSNKNSPQELSINFLAFSYISLIAALSYIAAKVLQLTTRKVHNYVTKIPHKHAQAFDIVTSKFLILLYCLILAGISQFIWKWKSGISSSLDWDTFFHQTIVNALINGRFSFITSHLSDSVRIDAYSSIFHTILAVPFAVFNPDIFAFWWFAGFIQLIIVTLTSYVIGEASYGFVINKTYEAANSTEKKNKILAGAITALFGAFSFISYQAYNPYFLIPQILSATVAANGLALLIYHLKYKSNHLQAFLQLLPVVVFIILNHYVLGTYCALILIGIYILFVLNQKVKLVELASFSRYISLLLLVLIPFVLHYFNFDNINPNESGFYALQLSEKIAGMINFYGYLWIILLPLGVIYLLRTRSVFSDIMFSVFIMIVASIISPIPYNLKFLAFDSFIFHSIMAMGFVAIVDEMRILFIKFKTFNLQKTVCYSILILGLTGGLIFNLTNNAIIYKQTPSYKDVFTHVSKNESEAANFIKKKYSGKNAMIISDPATMFVTEALSGVNSPGGAYVDQGIRAKLVDIYNSRDPKMFKENILSINDGLTGPADIYVIVLSHRYFNWVQSGNEQIYGYFFNIWQPIDLKIGDYDYLDYLKENVRVPVVFSNTGVVVFEVRR